MFRKQNLNIKTTLVIFIALIVMNLSLSQLRAQSGNESSVYEELYNNCLGFSLGNLCDFLFGKNSVVNVSNSTEMANYSALSYNDKNFGFIIRYPLGWIVDQDNKEFSIVRFATPQNDADVDIRIFPKGDYKTIEEYGNTFKHSNNQYKLLNYYKNSSTTLSDRQAIRAIYLTTFNASMTEKTYGNNSSNLKEMIVATMVPERESIYAIAYFAEPPDFDNYLPVVEKMIDSFQIYGKTSRLQEGIDNNASSTS